MLETTIKSQTTKHFQKVPQVVAQLENLPGRQDKAISNFPIGIAEYETQLVDSLPKDLKSSLPTIEEIEAELTNAT